MKVVLSLCCHIRPNFINVIVLGTIILLAETSPVFGQVPNETDTLDSSQIFVETDTVHERTFDTSDLEHDIKDTETDMKPDGISNGEENVPSFWASYVFDPMRYSLTYEMACKVKNPAEIKNNRFSFRLEYSKFLFHNFSLQIDTKISTFLKDDHRVRRSTFWIDDNPKEAEVAFGGRLREAYLQTSFHKTSIKAGVQVMAWGESDFATVIDEISPIDYREPLILAIDELRVGQLMLTVDQYSPFGKWSAFFIPYPEFNDHPKKGTGYYYDPFNGSVEYQKEKQDKNLFEYGVRWKKTFGNADFSIMAASLINNEYALRMVTPGLITQSKQRFSMAGITFNYAMNKFLVKGEVTMKSPKLFNDTSFQILKKNGLDASFGFDYTPTSTLALKMEAVNNYVIDWDDRIQGTPRDNYMIVLILSKLFMHNDLSVALISMLNGPNTGFFNMLSTSFNWNDHITLYFDTLIPSSNNTNSGVYIYRDQKQVAFKIQYQF